MNGYHTRSRFVLFALLSAPTCYPHAAAAPSAPLTAGGFSVEPSRASIAMRLPSGGTVRMLLPRGTPEPAGGQVTYRCVFPGIDLLLYRYGDGIEYDFRLAPRADPSRIRFSFTGARSVSLSSSGDLVIATSSGELRHRRPLLYQLFAHRKRSVPGSFALHPNGSIGFTVGRYDRSRPLIIDPQIVYRAYLSSTPGYFDSGTLSESYETSVSAAAVDKAGNLYVAGTNFTGPNPVNAVQSQCPSGRCLYVAKLSPDGKTILYATFLGGTTLPYNPPFGLVFLPAALTCDADGNVYVTGRTAAQNLPQVNGGTAKSAGLDDAFVVKLDPNGALRATLLVGGSSEDAGTAIAFGRDGFLYAAGITNSTDFTVPGLPPLPSFPKAPFGFVLKIDPARFSGDNPSAALRSAAKLAISPLAVAGDSQGVVYIASEFSIQRINTAGIQMVASELQDSANSSAFAALAVDAQDSLFVAGTNYSTSGGGPFIAKFAANAANLQFSTYLSSDSQTSVRGLALDANGGAYVSGITYSANFKVVDSVQSGLSNGFCLGYNYPDVYQNYCSPSAGFAVALRKDGSAPLWSTLLPVNGDAIAVDVDGNAYVVGEVAQAESASSSANALKLSPAASPLVIDAIGNAASFHLGLPAPGGLATMFVHGVVLPAPFTAGTSSWPLEVSGLSVTVAGIPAPLLSLTNTACGEQQINFQVPQSAPRAGSIAEVDVTYQGVTEIAVPPRVAPGLFVLADGSGAIQHASDYSLVTPANPAQPGEILIVYGTGVGDHLTSNYTPQPLNLGDVLFAGNAPGYPGLSQINFRLAANVPSGANQLTLTWIPPWSLTLARVPNVPANDSISNSVTLWVK